LYGLAALRYIHIVYWNYCDMMGVGLKREGQGAELGGGGGERGGGGGMVLFAIRNGEGWGEVGQMV